MAVTTRSQLAKLNFLFYLSSFVTITPLIDLRNNKVKQKMIYRIYTILFFIVIITIQFYSLLRLFAFREELDIKIIIKGSVLLEVSRQIFGIIEIIITSIGAAFWKMEKWSKLHKKITKLEHQLCPNQCFFTRYNTLLFFVDFLLSILAIIFINYTWVNELGFFVQSKYFVKYFFILCQHIKLFLAFTYIYIIYRFHTEVNNLFIAKFEKRAKIPINTFEQFQRKLGRLVQVFNDIFGVPLFFNMFQSSVFCLNYVATEEQRDFWSYESFDLPSFIRMSTVAVSTPLVMVRYFHLCASNVNI